jgi:hypothetical protein
MPVLDPSAFWRMATPILRAKMKWHNSKSGATIFLSLHLETNRLRSTKPMAGIFPNHRFGLDLRDRYLLLRTNKPSNYLTFTEK